MLTGLYAHTPIRLDVTGMSPLSPAKDFLPMPPYRNVHRPELYNCDRCKTIGDSRFHLPGYSQYPTSAPLPIFQTFVADTPRFLTLACLTTIIRMATTPTDKVLIRFEPRASTYTHGTLTLEIPTHLDRRTYARSTGVVAVGNDRLPAGREVMVSFRVDSDDGRHVPLGDGYACLVYEDEVYASREPGEPWQQYGEWAVMEAVQRSKVYVTTLEIPDQQETLESIGKVVSATDLVPGELVVFDKRYAFPLYTHEGKHYLVTNSRNIFATVEGVRV